MFNFNEAAIRREHENGLSIIQKTQEIVDRICAEGYKNVFYIGIGGTILYAGQFGHIVKQMGSALPLYLENAADFLVEGNPHFGKDSTILLWIMHSLQYHLTLFQSGEPAVFLRSSDMWRRLEARSMRSAIMWLRQPAVSIISGIQ